MKNCERCKLDYTPTCNRQKFCSACKIEVRREGDRRYYKNNPEKVRENQYKQRGYKLNGKPFTLADFNDLLVKQNNKCACCDIDFDTIEFKSIHVDHNHLTGNVRGLLCKQCNSALGYAKDNTNTLSRMIDYINKNKFTGDEVL